MAFMRHNNNGRRHNNNNRHRHNNNGQQQNPRRHVNRVNHVFESNGPEGRVRGTAQQIVEKYLTMARDASVTGDKVLSMNYFQHAEHYQRLLNEIMEESAAFEREREAVRATQQPNQQPDISSGDAESGFAEMASAGDDASGSAQPRQDRAPRVEREPRMDREPRPDRNVQRPVRSRPMQRDERTPSDDDDLNTLPGFLQVPIKESAPPVAAAAKVAVEKSEDKDAAPPRKPRVTRARRVVSTGTSDE